MGIRKFRLLIHRTETQTWVSQGLGSVLLLRTVSGDTYTCSPLSPRCSVEGYLSNHSTHGCRVPALPGIVLELGRQRGMKPRSCLSFLVLIQQITVGLAAGNRENLLSHRSGGQQSKNQGVGRALLPLKAPGESPSLHLPASGGSWLSLI